MTGWTSVISDPPPSSVSDDEYEEILVAEVIAVVAELRSHFLIRVVWGRVPLEVRSRRWATSGQVTSPSQNHTYSQAESS